MLSGILKTGKRISAAMLLLLLLLVSAEVWLQVSEPPPQVNVCPQLTDAAQPLLVPSGVVHHELRRLTTMTLPGNQPLQTNSLGLRGPEPKSAAEQQLRVLVLGDETVLGLHHDDQQTLPAVLRKFLVKSTGQQVEVVNAGVPGYAPLLSAIQFRQQLIALKPDLVLLHFDMNDVADDSYYRRLLKTTETAQVCDHPLLRPKPESAIARMTQQSALLRSLQTSLLQSAQNDPADRFDQRYRWTLPDRPDLRLSIQHALQPLPELAELCRGHNIPLLVSTSPVPWQVTGRENFPQLARQLSDVPQWPVTADLPNRILKAACDRAEILFCDARTAFAEFASPDRLFQPDTVHLSELGNSLYAREIASTILTTPAVASIFRKTKTAQSVPRPHREHEH